MEPIDVFLLVLTGAVLFAGGLMFGNAFTYDEHRNAIQLGYFASPEEIQAMRVRKDEYDRQRMAPTEKYGIPD